MADPREAEIQAAAARWHARLEDDADPRTLAEFERWRDADSAHHAAFETMATRHDEARALGEAPEILSLRQQTLARVATRRRKPDFAASVAGAALALLLVGAPLAFWIQAGRPGPASAPAAAMADAGETFRTGVGQQLALTLVDGSRVTLNTASRLRVTYDDTQRRMVLEAGEAWFKVAPDKNKPFVVIADTHRVVAHGTEFNVRLRPHRMDVMLAEGAVTVAPEARGPSSATVAMRPNQLLTVSASGTMLRNVSGDAWSSWREGIVTFEDQPLTDAVAEMNRYSRVQLRVADDRTGRIRVSGAFNIGATTAFVEALEMGFAIDARRQGDGNIVLRRRSDLN